MLTFRLAGASWPALPASAAVTLAKALTWSSMSADTMHHANDCSIVAQSCLGGVAEKGLDTSMVQICLYLCVCRLCRSLSTGLLFVNTGPMVPIEDGTHQSSSNVDKRMQRN